jgi:branched-chain amino acid transport system ATP-binding protein
MLWGGFPLVSVELYYILARRAPDRGYIIVHGEIAVAARSVDELKANDIVKRLYLGGIA